MKNVGKKRKKWTETGKKDHIGYYLIKNCKPIENKKEKED